MVLQGNKFLTFLTGLALLAILVVQAVHLLYLLPTPDHPILCRSGSQVTTSASSEIERLKRLEKELERAQRNLVWNTLSYNPEAGAVLFVSFPKSGRSWVRVMVELALQQHFNTSVLMRKNAKNYYTTEPFIALNKSIPFLAFTHGSHPSWSWRRFHPFVLNRSQIVTKGDYFHENFVNANKDNNIIFLARDPRDVVVSAYFERRFREHLPERKFHGTISEYVREPRGSFDSILTMYRETFETIRCNSRTTMLLRYEDLHEDPERELKRLLAYLKLDLPSQVVKNIVKRTSFEEMHHKEVAAEFNWKELKPRDATNQNTFKTREGKVGSFVFHVSKEDASWMTEKMKQELPPVFGYS